MTKFEFLSQLEEALSGLSKDEIEERLSFYSEIIDDSIEEGKTEEEAVADIGDVRDIEDQILSDVPLTKIVKDTIKPKRALKGWEIALIVIGFPIWLPLIICAIIVALVLYIVLCSLIICLWAIELSLWVCALGGVTLSVIYFIQGGIIPGSAMMGLSLFSAGISIFLFYGCVAASKGLVKLTKKVTRSIKSSLLRKGRAK